MGFGSIDRTVDRLLARVGEHKTRGNSGKFDPIILTDEQYFELEALLGKASPPGTSTGAQRLDGRRLSRQERGRVQELLQKMFTGSPGASRVLPWLLPDEDLNRLHRLLVKMRNPRTGRTEPERVSREAAKDCGRILSRATVVVREE